MIVKVKNREPLIVEKSISLAVVNSAVLGFVTVPVHLDDYFGRKPGEISNIRADWRLASKAGAARSEIAEQIPHFLFGFGKLSAKGAGPLSCYWIDV